MQFIKKTSLRNNILGLIAKLTLALVVILGIVFLLNKIDFPAPKKDIEKIIPNENFKIVKEENFFNFFDFIFEFESNC